MAAAELGKIVVIAGATASGKTALGVQIARAIGGEIIGADSVQVYRRLDVGSAKPSAEELQGVAHHLIDVAELEDPFDAARYVELADRAIAEVRARGRLPLVVGGSGLYLRALLRGLAEGIPGEPALRAALNARAARGPEELARMYAELAAVDPDYASKIHPRDPIRIVRALEVFALSGEPLSVHHARHAAQPPRYDALFVALETERSALRARIATRARQMLARGWVDEVRELLESGLSPQTKGLKSVGYAEIVRHVREGVPLDETLEKVIHSTAAFAKRQRTWFRGEQNVTWVRPEQLRAPEWLARIEAHFVGS